MYARSAENIHWRLLPPHPADDFTQAFAIVGPYRRRWAIEQLFRPIKSQRFDIEGILIDGAMPLRRLALAVLVTAVAFTNSCTLAPPPRASAVTADDRRLRS
ncbi:hypothetical protein [Magnetospirillum sp. UT-4]|uniref:hypothetical protein n=1 Tax=Magnetospirillum sp. UT-4 TaxID=2681467 RepID=UPI00137DAD48|nr:hypothetical protein [Magnetospirillum sp. UT-4]CAA7616675.1 hypothetical protein MTBUT4_230039 [Magnetospirillum sp. UT-4]